MYEGYKICPKLKAGQCCFVLEQYDKGEFEQVYHKHFPRSRISHDSKVEMLKAFVVRFDGRSGMGPDAIVASYLNGRKGGPRSIDKFRITSSYPEAGVQRIYCGTNTGAWIDDVIVPSKFRKKSA